MKAHSPNIATYTLIGVTGVLTFLLLRVTLPYHDDILYASSFNFPSYTDYISNLVATDSPRLFNILFPFILGDLPKWVNDVISASAFVIAVFLTLRIAGVSRSRYLRVALIILIMEVALPWDNGMTCTIFLTNYIWSLPLVAGFVCCYFSQRVPNILLVLLGALTGWAQEGESLPLLIGVLAWCIVNRRFPSPRQWCLIAPLTLMCAALIVLGIFGRYTQPNVVPNLLNQSLATLIHVSITKLNGTLAVTLLLLISAIFRSTRRRLWILRRGALPIMLAAMYSSYLVGLSLWDMGDRLTWFPQFFAIVSGAVVVNGLWPKVAISNRKTAISITVAILALIVVHLVSAILVTRKISRLTHVIERDYLAADSQSPFFEMIPPTRLPLLAWNKLGVADITINWWMWGVHSNHFAGHRKPYPVPSELCHITLANLVKIPGDNPLYLYDGLYVIPGDYSGETLEATVKFSLGVDRKMTFNLSPFTAADGTRWVYAVPDISDPQTRWIPIKEINQ